METVMVGIATEQNITNFIPAIECKVRHFILVETGYATKSQWGAGLKNALKNRQITLEAVVLSADEDNHISIISQRIAQLLAEKYAEADIIWNLGGGQKLQALALWEAFRNRSYTAGDRVCYLNPVSSQLEWWQYTNEELRTYSTPITVHLQLAEVLMLYGYSIKSDNKTKIIYQRGNKIPRFMHTVPDLLEYQEFRQYLYTYSKHLNLRINDQKLQQIIGSNCLNSNYFKNLGFPADSGQGYYFEAIVIQRIQALLAANETAHSITEAYANIEIIKTGIPGMTVAEYDVLCVSNKGKLFAYDAKTGNFDRKDNDARQHNLAAIGGKYGSFTVVLLVEPADFNEKYFPANIKNFFWGDKAKKLPFRVIAPGQQQAFEVLSKDITKPLAVSNVKNEDTITCALLDDMVADWK
jgi:hypothetical protein